MQCAVLGVGNTGENIQSQSLCKGIYCLPGREALSRQKNKYIIKTVAIARKVIKTCAVRVTNRKALILAQVITEDFSEAVTFNLEPKGIN